ncbi:MAG TPA: PfkB family carbohydrate kinase [Actinomycetota bacterium]|nr:PfkB family carbohydrate kinase [Actinomycetota bacterium]
MDLVVVGDVMVDVSVEAPALAKGGDVHGRVRLRPGGSAANAAVWAVAAGAHARVHGRVGDDLAGALVRGELERRGVEPALAVDPSAPTGSLLVVREAGERSVVADRGANAAMTPADLPSRVDADAVLVSGYLLLQRGSSAAARAALERSRARYVAIDAASWSLVREFGVEAFFEATAAATVLLANRREARILTGLEGEDAAEALARRYAVVCVKLGGEGAVMSWEGLLIRTGVDPVEEVDATGAGDAFDGVLLASLVAGASPGEALRAACRAGARVAGSGELWPEEFVG